VQGRGSFLWSDGTVSDILQADNVFAVMADNGMLVNIGTAYRFAKLNI
jgi:hypothetical protein